MGAIIADGETAAALETAAREKAWVDFLSHVRLSLEVWRIDPDVREHCEHVLGWLRRLSSDLAALSTPPVKCDACNDTRRVPWMVEADPNLYQEPDADGTIPVSGLRCHPSARREVRGLRVGGLPA